MEVNIGRITDDRLDRLTHSSALASGSEQKSSAVDCSSDMRPALKADRLSSPMIAGAVKGVLSYQQGA